MAGNPRNRQEFMRMQEQAVAAARDMQRRATLPVPGRGQEQRKAPPAQRFSAPPPRNAYSAAAQPTAAPQAQRPVHHQRPSQQARQSASYGRIRPQMKNQQAGGRLQQNQQHTQQYQPYTRPQNQQQARPQYQQYAHAQQNQQHSQPQYQQQSARYNAHSAAPQGPPLTDLFAMLGGLGGAPPPPGAAFEPVPPSPEGMDSILTMVLMLLLRQENADQGLLLALMYIMM